MADYEMSETCSRCGTNLIFTTADDPANEHGEQAITCPACPELKRTGPPDVSEGDVIGLVHDGEKVKASVMAIGHSGTIRVHGIGVVDIEPDQVIEVLEKASDPHLGKQITICHKTGTVRENPDEDDSYVVEIELGGIHQEIIVTEEYVQERLEAAD